MPKRSTNPHARLTLLIVLILGTGLALFQFFWNKSYWQDETSLALNILDRSPLELLGPLDHFQAAPPLFLLAVKGLTMMLSAPEFSLRLFPLISYLVSLVFLYRLARLLFSDKPTLIYIFSAFVFCVPVIYYSSELKQYMSDVMVTLILLYLTIYRPRQTTRKYVYLAVAGMIAVFLSNIAPIILLTSGLWLYSEKPSKISRPLVFVSLSWLAAFGVYYLNFVTDHPSREFMLDFWQKSRAFMPHNPFSASFYHFITDRWDVVFLRMVNFGRLSHVLFFLWVAGLALLAYARRFRMVLLLLLPFAIHLLLSMLRLYPFDLRLLLYLTPIIIIASAYGFSWFYQAVISTWKLHRFQWIVCLIPLPFIIMMFRVGYPVDQRQIFKTVSYLEEQVQPHDQIFLYHDIETVVRFYQQTGRINLSMEHVTHVTKPGQETLHYFEPLAASQGRIWLLFSNNYPGERTLVIDFLDARGFQRLDYAASPRAELFLYWLKEDKRISRLAD